MKDLEMTKLCAEAMGLCINDAGVVLLGHSFHAIYAPLTDDSQAMELMKKFKLDVEWLTESWDVTSWDWRGERYQCDATAGSVDLNRAIVECVAKLQAAAARTLVASEAAVE